MKILTTIVTWIALTSTVLATDDISYVGSKACAACHQENYQLWQISDHYKAMALASEESVLGKFSGSTHTFHTVDNRFYRKGDQFFVEIKEQESEPEFFEIKYTFGHFPLQQYLIEMEGGFIQALNVAWDSRPEDEGGQRWFHLRSDENITSDHLFHWKRHFQNWNARCADCHSTNLVKGYDQDEMRYSTKWSEINVACEACHGPASKHVEQLAAGNYEPANSGFSLDRATPVLWEFKDGEPIASPQGGKTDRHINMCGSCHSLRDQLTSTKSKNYHNSNRLQLLNNQSYFDDGQIREEVYVLGSFMQSKMYEQGVTCTNCHDPHSGKLVAEGNSLCAQCHQPASYDSPEHHRHETNSTGAQCVNCHMPERTYMQVDNRRDHSFTIPNPRLSMELGVPNACTGCHLGSQDKWALDSLIEWGLIVENRNIAHLNQRAQSGDILVTQQLSDLIKTDDLPEFVKASMISQFLAIPSRVSVEMARHQLKDQNPLVRRGAVVALQSLPSDMRWQILSPLIDDPNRAVRYSVAESLSGNYSEFLPEQQQRLDALISEYRQILSITADTPSTQLSLANLELALRNQDAAEQAYLNSLKIEPGYIPALLNLADYYRTHGSELDIEPLLSKALEVAPDSAAAQHSYGLLLIRQKNYSGALPYLASASELQSAQPRYAYVYAIALENTGDVVKAIEVLKSANVRWPNRYETLMTLVVFMDKSGNTESIYPYISALSTIAPNIPDVKKFEAKYAK